MRGVTTRYNILRVLQIHTGAGPKRQARIPETYRTFTEEVSRAEHSTSECVLTFRCNYLYCREISWRKPLAVQLTTLFPNCYEMKSGA